LDEVTQSNASAASEMAATANALADHARDLQKAISWFKTQDSFIKTSSFKLASDISHQEQKKSDQLMETTNLGKY